MTARTQVPTEFQEQAASATTRQLEYIRDLLSQKELPAKGLEGEAGYETGEQRRERALALVKDNGFSFQQAKRTIDWLLSLPGECQGRARKDDITGVVVRYEKQELDSGRKRVGFIHLPDALSRIPHGRYAIAGLPGFRNELNFFRVWVGERGGWSVQHEVTDERHRLAVDTQVTVLRAIAADPATASAAYGHHFSSCGVCGRRLTNDESRARGIGPVCAEKVGW